MIVVSVFWDKVYNAILGILNFLFQPITDGYKNYKNEDDPIFDIALAIVPVILSIAYPLIVQTISRFRDQYESSYIIDQFKKEKYHKQFQKRLLWSVIFTVLNFLPTFLFLVPTIFSIVLLIYSFFRYMNLLLKYLDPKELFIYYFEKLDFEKRKKELSSIEDSKLFLKDILDYWYPILSILRFSIKSKDRPLENDIIEKFIIPTYAISQKTTNNLSQIEYQSSLYSSTTDILNYYLEFNYESNVRGFEYFIGEIFYYESYEDQNMKFFHELTYYTIWRNFVTVIENKRFDLIIEHWKVTHQYFNLNFCNKFPVYGDGFIELPKSKEFRAKIEFHRKPFLQMHTVLCAYLMYKREFKTLNQLWFYTQEQPPSYYLILQSIEEIFNNFILFSEYRNFTSDIIIRYWFKDLPFDKLNNRRSVKTIVCEYLVLLFLRLYITDENLYNNPLKRYPTVPIPQNEKIIWKEKLQYFKSILEKHLEDKKMLKMLGLNKIEFDYCNNRDLLTPIQYIDNFIANIDKEFKDVLQNEKLDDQKLLNLKQKTVEYISHVYKTLERISRKDEILKNDRDSLSNSMEVIRGDSYLLTREGFLSNTGTHYINHDSIIGESIAQNYMVHFAQKLYSLKRKVELIVPFGHLFTAVEKLAPDPKKYIIIAFDVNLEYLRDYHQVKITKAIGNEDFCFNNMPIYHFKTVFSPVFHSLFLIYKEDLPMIKHRNWREINSPPKETINYWKSMDEEIDKQLHIYQWISDLNDEKENAKKQRLISNGRKEEELNNMVEINVDFLAYCWFKRNTEVIFIKEDDMLKEGGNAVDLNSISPLPNNEKNSTD